MQRDVRRSVPINRLHAVTIPLACLLLSLALIGCEAHDRITLLEDGLEYQSSAIVNGKVDSGHPFVGAILRYGGMCTATLVGLKTVLTASHCVQPGAKHAFFLANKYWQVSSVHQHPNYNPPSTDNDIAVARLTTGPPVTPGFISTVPPGNGQELVLVGYGATTHEGAGSGTKRVASNRVAYLTSTRIVINGASGEEGNLCFGDSGGPTFATIDGQEVQVGVHSTIAGECGIQGHDTRVDVYADWIDEVAEGDVAKDGIPSPAGDKEPPEVLIERPEPQAKLPLAFTLRATVTDNVALARVELVVDDTPSTSLTDPPFEFALELEPGEHRLAVVAEDHIGNRGEDQISVTVLEPARYGEPCLGSAYCASSLCASHDALTYAFCTQECDPLGEPCPQDADCYDAGNGSHACGPPAAALGIVEEEPAVGGGGEGGGCSVGGPQERPGLLVLALGILIGLARRRRLGR